MYLIVCGTEDCAELWIWNTEVKILFIFIQTSIDSFKIFSLFSIDSQHTYIWPIERSFMNL